MINLYEKGAYLVNGTELVDEDNTEKLAQLMLITPAKFNKLVEMGIV